MVDMIVNAKELKDIVVNKYNLSYEQYEQNLEKIEAEDTLLAIKILYSIASDSKLKVTQKRALAVRSKKLLDQQMPENYDATWLINMLVAHNYLENNKLILPTSKFHKLLKKSDGDVVKDIFNTILSSKYNHEIRNALFHTSMARGDGVKKFRELIVRLIKKQDQYLWINIDYLVNQIKLDAKTLKNITNNYKYCYNFYGSAQRNQYNNIKHLKVIVRYFLKTFFGIMSQTGLWDLGVTKFQAYNKEDLGVLSRITEVGASFANIEFYKLTDLGSYVLGFDTNFNSKNDYNLVLNDYNYEFKVENSNNLSDVYLEKIAIKKDDGKYKVDIKSFMKNIDTKEVYQHTKETFKNKVDYLPENWKQFFTVLDDRVNNISVVSKSVVLMKVQNNKDILGLISSTKKLQEKILKADKFHIVVMQKDFTSVKNILKDYGIVVS